MKLSQLQFFIYSYIHAVIWLLIDSLTQYQVPWGQQWNQLFVSAAHGTHLMYGGQPINDCWMNGLRAFDDFRHSLSTPFIPMSFFILPQKPINVKSVRANKKRSIVFSFLLPQHIPFSVFCINTVSMKYIRVPLWWGALTKFIITFPGTHFE